MDTQHLPWASVLKCDSIDYCLIRQKENTYPASKGVGFLFLLT